MNDDYEKLLQPIIWEIRCLRENVMLANKSTAELVMAIEMLQHENDLLREQAMTRGQRKREYMKKYSKERRRKAQLARLALLEKTLQSTD
jgi:hypothetical protein